METQILRNQTVHMLHSFGKLIKNIHQVLTGQEKTTMLTERQILENEVERLRKELHIRHLSLEQAQGEYIDIAIYELNLTQQKYDLAIRQLKKLHNVEKPTK